MSWGGSSKSAVRCWLDDNFEQDYTYSAFFDVLKLLRFSEVLMLLVLTFEIVLC